MNRADALRYVSYAVDDALSPRAVIDMPANARLIGWQCGFEPLFVAVWSYLNVRLDDDDAAGLASELLAERKWFGDSEPRPPDYIL